MSLSRIRRVLAVGVAATGVAVSLGTSPAQALIPQTAEIQFEHATHLALTADPAEFGKVRTDNYVGSTTQRWKIPSNTTVPSAFELERPIRLNNGQLGRGCLDLPTDVSASQQVSGVQLVVRQCDGTASQNWIRSNFQDRPNGTLTASTRNQLSGFFLEAKGGFTFPGPVIQSGFTNAPAQRTALEDLSSAF